MKTAGFILRRPLKGICWRVVPGPQKIRKTLNGGRELTWRRFLFHFNGENKNALFNKVADETVGVPNTLRRDCI